MKKQLKSQHSNKKQYATGYGTYERIKNVNSIPDFPSLFNIRNRLCDYLQAEREAVSYDEAECIFFELRGFVHALAFFQIIPLENADYWRLEGLRILQNKTNGY